MFTISMFVVYILTVVSSKSDNALARLPAAKYKLRLWIYKQRIRVYIYINVAPL